MRLLFNRLKQAKPTLIASLRPLTAIRRDFASGARDLVMGFAAGYPVTTIRPFVESLFTAGAFVGKTVLFVKPEDTELALYLQARGVTVVFFDPQAYQVSNLVMARWFAYSDYLRSEIKSGKRYRNILLTDVRDVIFQKPLFSVPCGDLEFHYEAASPCIGKCEWNSYWIREAFGEDILARLADKRISCSGTVTGQIHGVLLYLEQMQVLMLSLPDDVKKRWADQAVHNYVVHSGLVTGATILENFRRVATLHYVSGAEVHPDEDSCVVNPDGQVSEIAHQWDRHPHLTAAIMEKALERQRQWNKQT